MIDALTDFFRDETGLTAVEYAIAGALVVAAGTAGFIALGSAIDTQIGNLEGCVNGIC